MLNKLLPIAALTAAGAVAYIQQATEPLTNAQLRKLVDDMGYTTKPIGDTGKFEFPIKTETLNIPIGAETSTSGNYIWFTVVLSTEAGKKEAKYGEMLKQNAKLQPNFFYITDSGRLMMGVAVDNRGVTPAIVKRITDKLVADVGKTSGIWQN